MAEQKNKKELKFELLDELKVLDRDLFNNEYGWILPQYILDNLKHMPRFYQEEAIRYFHYTQASQTFKYRQPKELMFNMATGSGKTDLMAGLILYLFKEKGYQNFLFTVNSTGVLSKTIDNLINRQSHKYLYQEHLEIDGDNITINKIEGRFPDQPNKNHINIKFVTIQSLTNELFTVSENVMSLKDYAKYKMVILADEAHHYSASTKNQTKTEKEQASWENTLSKLCETNHHNLLLEFTATLDFNDDTIYHKYKNRIVYRYTLDRYILDQYSKNVRRIQTGNSNEENMLSTVLLSEYRRKYALENLGIEIKPVILFKSHKIDASHEANRIFNNVIDNLTAEELRKFITSQMKSLTDETSHTLHLAYQYYLTLDNLDNVVREIKRGFSPSRILNANDTDSSSKGLLETGQYQALNTLESPSNLYRVVFAVAKLTEGWDVLNLYDIVRISSLGKSNDRKDMKATNSEAQLIGRGARYYPLSQDSAASYKRKFDEDNEEASLLLETLHYHTLNEPQYIKNLLNSLDAINLATGEDDRNPPIEIKIKPSFKQTKLYKDGKIYYNEIEEIPDSAYTNLRAYGIDISKLSTVRFYKTTRESSYNTNATINLKIAPLEGIDIRYFKKAVNKLRFFHFNQLVKYLPNIKSIDDFWGIHWLNLKDLCLSVETEQETVVSDFSSQEKLKIVELFLENLASKIKSGYRKAKGTNRFKGYLISEYLSDYNKRIPKFDTAAQSQQVSNIRYSKSDFFVYESAIINQTEKSLIDVITNHVPELRERYGEVYLIRMDENMLRGTERANNLKLHQFDKNPDTINLDGFQPDFILLLQNQEYYLQIFIEPKGDHLLDKDQWKEDILTYINTHQAELEFEADVEGVIIKGLRFYTQGDKRNIEGQLAQIALNKPVFDGNIKLNPL
ncbi:DEAD/DEAH box helicase family protein [Aerococcaceae bacterium NML130460]|nr:DEAD/DEAH box helicase family protein [Aerococcaceae bacterium NML130460]